ncbi:hypothetical protein RGQ29_026519 [Quercus rubra]|uniref:Uncharacterized protein n=1 Tax=Quercus rubra TaxID=3512 RepID=A0AAN7IJE2_QUERU|nr:hypothetical protein RGQ29_026519 [Quercus rubra]
MAEIALAGALALVDRLVLVYQYVTRDVEEVKKWLDTMKSFLKDIEGREDTEGLKDRVEKVRNLAYETEDAIEEYMFQVPEHFHPNQVRKNFHNVAHPVKNFIPGIQLSSSMRYIKGQLKDINDLDTLRILSSNLPSSSMAGEIPPEAYPYSSIEPLVGIERRGEELVRLILNNEPRDVVISVLGGAGSGKTTLIYEVYQMVKVTFECHAWVPVSRSCEGMLERIWEALELPAYQGGDRRRCLHAHLQQKRYILVLDGIWSEDEWKCIRNVLPRNNQGSRTIISTRKRNIASCCATSQHFIYNLNLYPLTNKEASDLFLKKAFPSGKSLDSCADWSEKIVKRCEGLPQAIVAIGNILSNKPKTVTEFKKVHDNLEFEPGSLEYIRKFSQSYYHLSPNLKSCFMYFCNFPEDYSVTRGRLIRLWIAEGFIEKIRGQTLEQVADDYLDELVQMSLVQVSRWDCEGRVRSCRVSNLVRGFILSKSEKENFVTVITTPQTNWSEKHRRLSLHICNTNILQGKDFSYVRTFSMFGGEKSFELLVRGVFSNFRLLRVLDLENAVLLVFPQQVVTLNLLRYLSLRKTKIDSLPKSIKKLQNLMVLDLRQTSVLELPMGILEIPKLLYLLVDGRGRNNAIAGVEVPQGIGCLKWLQKLSLIKANNKKGSIVEELGNLIELRKLGITELKNEDGRDICASIEKMEYLSSLHVESANEYLDLKYVQKPPQMINSLFLGGRLHNIPEWILSLNGLFKLKLRRSQLAKSPIEVLRDLPSLKVLHLHDAYSGEVLEFQAGWFLELRILVIEQCRWLKCVVIPEQAMPKLQTLTIEKGDSLTMVRIAISTLTRIEETSVPEELLEFLD